MTWNGATLYRSTDAGGSYSAFTSTTTSAIIGVANGALGDFGGGNVFDELNTVTVSLQSGGTLTSYTELQVLNGAGLCVLGAPGRWEILQYKVATLVGPKTYRLSGLLRGRRGTEWAMGLHAPGDRFTVADPNAWRRPNPGNSEIGLSRLYKGVTARASLGSATAQSFTNTAAGLRPYAPVHIGGGSDTDGNLTINWVRRTRIDGAWRDNVDVPIGEASEAYEVDIMDATFTTIKRTLSGLSSPTVVYSAADQVADGIAPGDPVYAQVYQLSSTVGRGYPGRGALRHTGEVVTGGGSGGGSDTGPVAPVLTSPAAAQTGPTTALGSVTTNQGNGTLYSLFSTSSTATAAQVKAGLSQAVTAVGAQVVNAAGLTADMTYYPHYLHRNSSGLESAVATGASFTTAASGGGAATVVPVPTGIANGSTVTLARDTIYRGTLDIVGKSNVTVVAAAGTGAAPIITPGQPITGWTLHSGQIYKASVGFVPVQISLSDVPVKRASWPVTVPNWATSTSGMPSADVTGATLYQLTNQSRIDSSVLSSNSVPTNLPFYLEGKLWMLTGANAWAYENGFLYVWTPDGQTPEGRAWAAPDAPGINADNSSGVTIGGIDVKAASNGISGSSSTNLHITSGYLKNLSRDGVYASGSTGLVVDGLSITNARENGINAFYGSTSVTVKNCPKIENIGMVGNPCPSLAGIFIGGPNTNTLVQNNTVNNTSYIGISVNQNRSSNISGNTVDGFCKVLRDGGGIYTRAVDRTPLTMTISGNTVKNGTGSEVYGVYLDDGSNGVTVTGNTLTNNTVGLLLHDAFNNVVQNNTFTKSTVQHILFANAGSSNSTTYGNQVKFNTMTLNNNEYAYNLGAGSNFAGWATWSNNTYTSNNTDKFALTWDGVNAGIEYSYTGWKAMIGQDANSTMNGA